VDRDPEVVDLYEYGVAGLERVVRGDAQEAIGLSTRFGAVGGGFELLAAGALELAARGSSWEGAEVCSGIAAELMNAQRPTQSLGLRPERQILSCLLKWGTGRGGF
jgi:hypothetical protein